VVSLEYLMATTDIAVVVPVLEDTTALKTLVGLFQGWTLQPAEIIVVSAGSNDRLRDLCQEHHCRYVESISCRGAQLDRGAVDAAANILWFLHADAEPNPDSLREISRALDEGAEGGYFRFMFLGKPAWWKALLARLINLRIRLGGIPYGDQGIFVRRDVYIESGGFASQPLFEEVALVKTLRSRGHFHALALPIGVAARRWERDGWWYRSLTNRSLAIRYLLGASAERLAEYYEQTSVTDKNANS
jgi:rSAM/selenodomain-associated transferase 2